MDQKHPKIFQAETIRVKAIIFVKNITRIQLEIFKTWRNIPDMDHKHAKIAPSRM